MNRSNIRNLQRAADALAEDENTPQALIRYLNELEEILRQLEQALRRYTD